MEEQIPSVNFGDYAELKAAGMAKVVSAGESFAIFKKRFDPKTGARLADEVIGINKKTLDLLEANLTKRLEAIRAFRADVEKEAVEW